MKIALFTMAYACICAFVSAQVAQGADPTKRRPPSDLSKKSDGNIFYTTSNGVDVDGLVVPWCKPAWPALSSVAQRDGLREISLMPSKECPMDQKMVDYLNDFRSLDRIIFQNVSSPQFDVQWEVLTKIKPPVTIELRSALFPEDVIKKLSRVSSFGAIKSIALYVFAADSEMTVDRIDMLAEIKGLKQLEIIVPQHATQFSKRAKQLQVPPFILFKDDVSRKVIKR